MVREGLQVRHWSTNCSTLRSLYMIPVNKMGDFIFILVGRGGLKCNRRELPQTVHFHLDDPPFNKSL